MRLDTYLVQWVEGQRLKASTLSSYRKNIRLHIDPHLGATPLSRLTGTAVDAWMRTLETSGVRTAEEGCRPAQCATSTRSAVRAGGRRQARAAGREPHRPVDPT